MTKNPARFARTGACFAAVCLILALSSGAWGQKSKKSKDKNPDAADQTQSAVPPQSVGDQIDDEIGQMLAAFQLGNVEGMHKFYADNATFVRGTYDPPVVGWQNYAALYNQQRAAFQSIQIIRRNTYVFVHADVAWASYQWEFDSMLNGRPYTTRGQTTLVFTKTADNWLIVHNHTSEVMPDTAQTAGQAPAPSAQP